MLSKLFFSNLIFLLCVSSRTAAAHSFVQRYDLPLPLSYYLAGAGSAVFLAFLLLLTSQKGSNAQKSGHQIDLTQTILGRFINAHSTQFFFQFFSVIVFIVIIGAGLFGHQKELARNILPTMVWIIWWVGFAFFCALIGNIWPAINPWLNIIRLLNRFFPKLQFRPRIDKNPQWIGPLLFLIFAWMELVWTQNSVPQFLAIAILVYSLVTWTGMFFFGPEKWLSNCEIFTIIFELFGKFAPIVRDNAGCLLLRPIAIGLQSSAPLTFPMTVLIITLLATVTFDGFLHTPTWQAIYNWGFGLGYEISLVSTFGNQFVRTLIMTAGLLLFPLGFFCIYLATCFLTGKLLSSGNNQKCDPVYLATRLILSLVPIAIAYHLSHYLSLLMFDGQRIFPLLSDPFGIGWNLFNTAYWEPDISVLNAKFLWGFAFFAIVSGHIAALYLTQRSENSLFPDLIKIWVFRLPMLVLMVGYTILSLWILAQPIVET